MRTPSLAPAPAGSAVAVSLPTRTVPCTIRWYRRRYASGVITVGILAPGAAPSVGAVARRAAAGGSRVEVVGVAPAGPEGDRQLLDFAAAGVGHATVSRSAAEAIEAADLELALRYLPDIRVVVLVAPDASLLRAAAVGAAWAGATLLLIGPLAADAAAVADDAGAIVLDPPARDPDEAFAGLVAAFAGRLDAGEDAAGAWRSTLASLAVDRA